MKKCLITGGMGFIGFNAALHYAKKGYSVVVFDDCSRATAVKNRAEFLKMRPPGIAFVHGDVRDGESLVGLFKKHRGFDLVLHLAAQVAVTSSVVDPAFDFETNARGTLNVLEAVRKHSPKAFVIFASTNKVYGEMPFIRIGEKKSRYFLKNPPGGINEEAPLDFHSPYGCSKGAGDQYVRDYARIYGLKTVVFRQSCIFGPWQYGEADQGWVAWFLIAALSGRRLVIYGNGKQVRDALHIKDLLGLYDRARERSDKISGQIFNVGGGPKRTLSLLELLDWIKSEHSLKPGLSWKDWRPGDQKIYVSDISKAKRLLGWEPRIGLNAGLEELWGWLTPRLAAAGGLIRR